MGFNTEPRHAMATMAWWYDKNRNRHGRLRGRQPKWIADVQPQSAAIRASFSGPGHGIWRPVTFDHEIQILVSKTWWKTTVETGTCWTVLCLFWSTYLHQSQTHQERRKWSQSRTLGLRWCKRTGIRHGWGTGSDHKLYPWCPDPLEWNLVMSESSLQALCIKRCLLSPWCPPVMFKLS